MLCLHLGHPNNRPAPTPGLAQRASRNQGEVLSVLAPATHTPEGVPTHGASRMDGVVTLGQTRSCPAAPRPRT